MKLKVAEEKWRRKYCLLHDLAKEMLAINFFF